MPLFPKAPVFYGFCNRRPLLCVYDEVIIFGHGNYQASKVSLWNSLGSMQGSLLQLSDVLKTTHRVSWFLLSVILLLASP